MNVCWNTDSLYILDTSHSHKAAPFLIPVCRFSDLGERKTTIDLLYRYIRRGVLFFRIFCESIKKKINFFSFILSHTSIISCHIFHTLKTISNNIICYYIYRYRTRVPVNRKDLFYCIYSNEQKWMENLSNFIL